MCKSVYYNFCNQRRMLWYLYDGVFTKYTKEYRRREFIFCRSIRTLPRVILEPLAWVTTREFYDLACVDAQNVVLVTGVGPRYYDSADDQSAGHEGHPERNQHWCGQAETSRKLGHRLRSKHWKAKSGGHRIRIHTHQAVRLTRYSNVPAMRLQQISVSACAKKREYIVQMGWEKSQSTFDI